MKFVRLSGVLLRNALRVSSYSTTTATAAKPDLSTKKWTASMPLLYRRISPIGDPTVSIVPVLEQWVQQGLPVEKHQLQLMIKELRCYGRFKHALEMSMWMSDKQYLCLSPSDVAVRLELISKVHGIEQAVDYFNNISKVLRVPLVYGALLDCYANVRNVEKAEATMDKMMELGFARVLRNYNTLLNLYCQTGNYEKLENLLHEMEENGVGWDKYTYGIRMTAYGAVADVEGLDKTVTRMESDPSVVLDWAAYSAAASRYAKAGALDKALAMLKKSEGLISVNRSNKAYNYLMCQYATYGKKDEVLRLWEIYMAKKKVLNKGFLKVIPSVLKFDDLECAERIFEEWESQVSHYDMRIPNFLIGAYSRKGLMQEAETLIDRAILKGGKPDYVTLYHLAEGYLKNNQPQKAVEKLKQALVIWQNKWKPNKTVLASCLECYKREGDAEGAGNFINLLGDKNIISVDVQDELLNSILSGDSDLDPLSVLNGDASL